MEHSSIQRKAEAAWARITTIGGHGVWERELVAVSLAGTNIRDDDLAVFDEFPFVQILDLSHTAITDKGLAHLHQLETLEQLSIIDTKISVDAIGDFRRCRPSVKVMTRPEPKGGSDPFTGRPRK